MKRILIFAIAALLLAACGAPEEKTAVSSEQTEEKVSLSKQMLENRAIEAVIWGMPIVNYERMLQAAEKLGAGYNDVLYFSHPLNWKTQTLTPNPNAIYLNPFINTTEGPMVLEIPKSIGENLIVGTIDDAWQMPLVDVGVGGHDNGGGAKYLILPPHYDGDIPEGYVVLKSHTYQTFAILRSNITEDNAKGIEKAVDYGKTVKLYPLSNPEKETSFFDLYDKDFDATIPYDFRYFESLNRMVQSEPWINRDKAMINILEYIGIKKGEEFNPTAEVKETLNQAITKANEFLVQEYDNFSNPFNEGKHWSVPIDNNWAKETMGGYLDENQYSIDKRAVPYTFAYFFPKKLGAGQFYLLSIQDSDGNQLDGSKNYKINVPANAPINLYWSIVMYSKTTHALVTEMSKSSIASNMPGLEINEDGSVDVYFGEVAPKGKESNWIPTKKGEDFEFLFRLYGPKKAFFDKTWVLNDIELIK